MSYSQVEEIDTLLCLRKLTDQTEDGVALPEFLKRFIQVTCAWNNTDSLEETEWGWDFPWR